jgi:hypothetical protein
VLCDEGDFVVPIIGCYVVHAIDGVRLEGSFLFGDFCSGKGWGAQR